MIISGERLVSPIKNKTRISTLNTFIWCSLEVLDNVIKQEKESRQTRKKKVKLSLFFLFLYIKYNLKSSKKLLELESEFSNITAFEGNIKKSTVFLYASNKQLENRTTRPLIRALKKQVTGISMHIRVDV